MIPSFFILLEQIPLLPNGKLDIREIKEQIRMGVACQAYPYIFNHTTIEVDNPFRVRTLGTMRQFHGIEGVDCEVVPIVNKGAACGLMNVQILAKKDAG